MPLARLDQVSLAYGLHPLLDRVDLQIRRGEHCCLLGRNGEGKSSLLKLLAGRIAPDAGTVWVRPGARVALLDQEIDGQLEATVAQCVAAGLDLDPRGLESWEREQLLVRMLARFGLDAQTRMSDLSGGWRRRALLARALICDPDMLLLDEPTNHLDIDAIDWLEQFLADFQGAVLFVSHDRSFVRRLAARILELDRGTLRSWNGGYDDYLAAKRAALEEEARHAALFDRKWRQEEAWIRQGVEARRTRNEGRVRALMQLRRERAERRQRGGSVQARLQEADAGGRLVMEARNVSHDFDGRCIIRDFSVRIMRGDRIGIVGPNGCGKSTLIKLLTGELAPSAGSVRLGTGLATAYYDQQREQLDPARSIADNVTGGAGDSVTIDGKPRHIHSYLQDFLFSSERVRAPVSMLSGGERNRLLLARLFARPVNLLILDEPTNDLDVETLDLLEELIADYQGTLLLVSHDRTFLDRVVTSTLAFDGDGRVNEYVGGYADWLRQRPPRVVTATPEPAGAERSGPATLPREPAPAKSEVTQRGGRLSFKDARELAALPEKIQMLEQQVVALQARSQAADFYQQPPEAVAAELRRLTGLEAEVEAAYARWQELDAAGG